MRTKMDSIKLNKTCCGFDEIHNDNKVFACLDAMKDYFFLTYYCRVF